MSDEQGQTMVFVAVVMLVLLGLAAIALDMGEILWSRGAEQSAADAAALAGVRQLPGDATAEAAAVAVARDYAGLNGFADSTPGVQVTPVVTAVVVVPMPGATPVTLPAVDVSISRTVPPGLRAAVGGGNIVVPARAVAVVTSVQNLCNVLPIAVENAVQPYDPTTGSPTGTPVPYQQTYGQMVELKASPGGSYSSGNFGSLALSNYSGTAGNGGSDYRDFIASGGGCVVGTDLTMNLDTKTGAMNGPNAQGFQNLVESAVGSKSTWPGVCASTYPDGQPVQCTYDGSDLIPDDVHWEMDEAYGLGSPNSSVDSGCTGPPPIGSADPSSVAPVVVGSCKRVVTVPVVAPDVWQNGSSTVQVSDWAAFYVFGTVGNGTNMSVVGAFIKDAQAPTGTPLWGDPTDASQVGYFLWK